MTQITDKSNKTLENLVGLVTTRSNYYKLSYMGSGMGGLGLWLFSGSEKTGLFELYSNSFYSTLGSLYLAPNLNDEVGRQLLG